MSMGMVLESVRDWLRERNSWPQTECGVQLRAVPPNIAGQKYIAIDDDGVDAGPDKNRELSESFGFEVAIWRRPSHLAPDMTGMVMLTEDRYKPEISTLNDLERRVIKHLHQNWDYLAFLNDKFGLADAGRGDNFILPPVYRGRSKIDFAMIDQDTAFIGRRMKFRGLKRVQKHSIDLG